MKEVERITDQLQRAFEGHAWHGPSVREVLSGITAEQAAKRIIPAAHTIWEITLHIAAWKSIVRRRIAGEPSHEIPPEEDWPAVGAATETAWNRTLQELELEHKSLRNSLEGLTDERLSEIPKGAAPSLYVFLHGVVQHDIYHAGQIALLKKAITS